MKRSNIIKTIGSLSFLITLSMFLFSFQSNSPSIVGKWKGSSYNFSLDTSKLKAEDRVAVKAQMDSLIQANNKKIKSVEIEFLSSGKYRETSGSKLFCEADYEMVNNNKGVLLHYTDSLGLSGNVNEFFKLTNSEMILRQTKYEIEGGIRIDFCFKRIQ